MARYCFGCFQRSWRTINAERLQLFANGALIYEPIARETGLIAAGSTSVPPPLANTTYELVAWGHEGTRVSESKSVKVVNLPSIDTFTLQQSVNQPGDPALAQWATGGATDVTLRIKDGPVVYSSKSALGSTQVYPGVDTTFELEAWNEAHRLDPAIFEAKGIVAVADGDLARQYYLYAKVLAARGDTGRALQYLSKALGLGFRDFSRIESDRDFASLVADPRYAVMK